MPIRSSNYFNLKIANVDMVDVLSACSVTPSVQYATMEIRMDMMRIRTILHLPNYICQPLWKPMSKTRLGISIQETRLVLQVSVTEGVPIDHQILFQEYLP